MLGPLGDVEVNLNIISVWAVIFHLILTQVSDELPRMVCRRHSAHRTCPTNARQIVILVDWILCMSM